MADLVIPTLGESISEAVISKWLKQVGESTAADEPVVDLETDKVSVALPAPGAGVLIEQRFGVGATVKVGDVIGTIAEQAKGVAAPAAPVAAPAAPVAAPVAPVAAPVAPVAAPVAPAAAPVAAPAVGGDGVAGRPSHHHPSPAMRKALREHRVEAPAPLAPPAAPPAAAEPEEVVPMTPLRRRIAERLVA